MKEFKIDEYLKEFSKFQDLENVSEEKINIFIDIFSDYFPKKLYKYRSFDVDGYNVDSLKNQYIWLSNPKDFDDNLFDATLNIDVYHEKEFRKELDLKLPRILLDEMNKSINYSSNQFLDNEETIREMYKICFTKHGRFVKKSAEEYLTTKFGVKYISEIKLYISKVNKYYLLNQDNIKEIAEKYLDQFNKLRNVIRDNVYIFCFSKQNNLPNMWAEFSDKSRGFCIEYDISNIKSFDLEYKKLIISIFPVIYKNKRPLLKLFDLYEDITKLKLDKKMNENLFNILYKSIITKKNDFNSQKECRLIVDNNHNNKLYFPFISKVFLGKEISKENEKIMIDIKNSKDSFELYKCHISNDKINFHKIR